MRRAAALWQAGYVAALCAGFWLTMHLRWSPDFELYTQGGVGLWPSLPGRLLGNLGPDGFALLGAVSAGLVVYLVARRNLLGGLALCFSLAPLYLAHASIDAIALALYTLAVVGVRPLLLAPLAAVTHLALVPYVALELWRRRPNPLVAIALAFLVGVPVLLALALTPYNGVLLLMLRPEFFGFWLLGTLAGILLAGPLLLLTAPTARNLVPLLAGGLLCGMVNHLQARYLLPAVVLLSLQARAPAWLGARAPALAGWGARLRLPLVRSDLDSSLVLPTRHESPARHGALTDNQPMPRPNVSQRS